MLFKFGFNNNSLTGSDNKKVEDPSKNKNALDTTKSYDPDSMDQLMSENIKNFLVNDYLKDELKFLTDIDRKFQMYMIDLNNDGKDEYFVRFSSPYFCGSGGCTFLLIDRYAKIITKFSVMDPPIYLTEEKTNGWLNLYVYNYGSHRVLSYNGKTYPSNPSVVPKTKLNKEKIKKTIFDDNQLQAYTYTF